MTVASSSSGNSTQLSGGSGNPTGNSTGGFTAGGEGEEKNGGNSQLCFSWF